MRSVRKYIQEKIVPIPRDEVWSLLSDTNHMNRVIQMFKLDFEGVDKDSIGGHYKAVTKYMGIIKVRWKEYPFEWSKGRYYSVYREYLNGPVKSFFINVEFHDAEEELPNGGGKATRIVLDVHVKSANLLGDIVVPITVHKQLKRIFGYTLNYLQQRIEGKQHPVPQLKREYEVNKAELERLFRELQQMEANPAYISFVRNHLLNYDDDMVMDMRVYDWAREWKCDRDDLLRFFLYSTQVGILNLSWHLICPNCRVSKSSSETLSQVGKSYHCEFCGITYENNMDKYMELRFSVHPAIRKAYKQVFCIGGPAITPHIESQINLKPQQTISCQIPTTHKKYRVRVLQTNHIVFIQYEPGAKPVSLDYSQTGWPINEINYCEDQRALTLHNESEQAINVVLEEDDWEDITVTASKVGTMPEFRRMFSSEILAPGHEMGIENVTFFFSDLLGSTSFYENVGDAPAYGQVRQHFDFMAKWIHLNRGSIVKKIGDAVMAVFEKPEDGIKAALEIQQHVDEFNATSINASQDEPIVIKIGVHHGNAISVNSDDRMDYFGRNVNIAARVQGISQGNDVVISSSCMARTGVAELLAAMHVSTTQLEATLRGIENKQTVYRLQLI